MTIEKEMFELNEFNKIYMRWIVERMGGENHLLLFTQMHDTLFKWNADVPMDENRESDGRRLRYIFEDETGCPVPQVAEEWPASFLEVVVSLAETMEECIMHTPESGNDSSTWFWMMLDNLGLYQCDDVWMREYPRASDYVAQKINDVIFRRYDRTGNGGLFPLRSPKGDQRCVELWYQMNQYILEKELV